MRFVLGQSLGHRGLQRDTKMKTALLKCPAILNGTARTWSADTMTCVILKRLASLSMRTTWSASSWGLRVWDRDTSVGLKEPPFPLKRSTMEAASGQLLRTSSTWSVDLASTPGATNVHPAFGAARRISSTILGSMAAKWRSERACVDLGRTPHMQKDAAHLHVLTLLLQEREREGVSESINFLFHYFVNAVLAGR